MYGLFLKWAVRICMLTGYSLEISGLTFDVERKLGGLWWAYNFRVNGKKLRLWRHYRLAVPEGLITGGMSIAKKLAEIIFNNPNEYELSIQEAIAFKLKKETIINDDQEDQKLNLENPKRMMIPSFNLRN